MIARVLGTLSLVAVALLTGATWYESVVMAPNYERDVPRSITLAREFLQRTNPAHYFRVVAPVAQMLTLLTVVASWHRPGHWLFVVAFALLILGDVITFAYHYPRLAIMFKAAGPQDAPRLARAAHEWTVGNWVRGVLLVVVLLAVLQGLLDLAARRPIASASSASAATRGSTPFTRTAPGSTRVTAGAALGSHAPRCTRLDELRIRIATERAACQCRAHVDPARTSHSLTCASTVD